MRNILFVLVFTSFCLRAWIWFCNIFSHLETKKLLILSGLSGILTGGVMLIFPQLSHFIFQKDFFSLENYKLGLSLAGFCLAVILVYTALAKSKFLFFMSGFFLIVFGLIIFGPWGGVFSILLFAFVEEVLKFGAGYGMREKNFLLKGDIILFLLISGLGFAWIENIRYGLLASSGVFGLMAIRGAVGFLAHGSFSSSIGYIGKDNKKFLPAGVLVAFLIHSFYNYIVGINTFYSIIFAIIGYFWLTFVLEKSNTLYLK